MDLLIGLGVTIISFWVGAVIMTRLVDFLAPHVKSGWKWLSSHIAFLLILAAGYYLYTGQQSVSPYYVEPTKVSYAR